MADTTGDGSSSNASRTSTPPTTPITTGPPPGPILSGAGQARYQTPGGSISHHGVDVVTGAISPANRSRSNSVRRFDSQDLAAIQSNATTVPAVKAMAERELDVRKAMFDTSVAQHPAAPNAQRNTGTNSSDGALIDKLRYMQSVTEEARVNDTSIAPRDNKQLGLARVGPRVGVSLSGNPTATALLQTEADKSIQADKKITGHDPQIDWLTGSVNARGSVTSGANADPSACAGLNATLAARQEQSDVWEGNNRTGYTAAKIAKAKTPQATFTAFEPRPDQLVEVEMRSTNPTATLNPTAVTLNRNYATFSTATSDALDTSSPSPRATVATRHRSESIKDFAESCTNCRSFAGI